MSVACGKVSIGAKTVNIVTVPITNSTNAAATPANCIETGRSHRLFAGFVSSVSFSDSAINSSLTSQIARIIISELFIMYTLLFKVSFQFVSGSKEVGFDLTFAHVITP